MKLSTWTAADAAEMNVLIDAFVDVAFIHKEKCATCSARGPWCAPLRDAFDGMLDWRRTRHLRSTAAQLRLQEDTRSSSFSNRVTVTYDDRGEVVDFTLRPALAEAA